MAEMGYGCVYGDCTNQPNHLLTTISPAVTVSLCDDHYPVGLIPLLAAELGVDPTEFYANVERYLARERKKAEAAVADAQAANGAEGSDGQPPPDGDDDQADDAAAAAEDIEGQAAEVVAGDQM